MDTSMLGLLFGKEALERAKKRGRAYMCLACHHQTGERRIGELGPMEDHVLKTHVSRDRVPFYCRLCTFKCQTKQQMDHHTRHYSRHVTMANARGITSHEEWQVQSPVPYRIGEADLAKFSQEDSILFYLKKQSMEPAHLQNNVFQMATASSDTLAEELTAETLQQGYITMAEDPAVTQRAIQPMQRPLESSVGQWIGGLTQQARTTLGMTAPLQMSHLGNIGPQRTFPQAAIRNDDFLQGVRMASTPPGSFHPSPLPSPGCQFLTTPEARMGAQGTNKAVTAFPFPQLDLQPRGALTPQVASGCRTMTAYPGANQVVLEGAVQPGAVIGVQASPVVSNAGVGEAIQTTAVVQAGVTSEPTKEPEAAKKVAAEAHAALSDEAAEEVEDLWPQLMSKDDSDQISDVASQSGSDGLKRKAPEEEASETEKDGAEREGETPEEGQASGEPDHKKRRTEVAEPTFDISLVALNSLTSAVQRLSGQMTRTERNQEKTEKALVDMTCALSKVTDALYRVKNVLEEGLKEERRREDRWAEMERRREEERRKDREAEQRREDRRREAERKEREEIRRLLMERKEEEKKEKQKGDKMKDVEGKENSKGLKSVLGKSYTENSMKDLSKKK